MRSISETNGSDSTSISRSQPTRVALFGEILFDEFPDRRVLGGAPLNVTRHLRAFGLDPLLVSRVGEDEGADEALEAMRGYGLSTSGVQRDPARPTGRVRVTIAGGGHEFEIVPDQAYDFVEPAAARRAVAAHDPALFYFGTLAQRNVASRGALLAALEATACPRFVDVNLRAPWYDREIVELSLGAAHFAKLNDDELEEVTRMIGLESGGTRERAVRLVDHFALAALVVTCGEHGAWLLTGEGSVYRVEGRARVDGLVDTVGAGDGFAAVVVLGTLRGWPPDETLARADEFAREICRIRGAIPPTDDFYISFRERWRLAAR